MAVVDADLLLLERFCRQRDEEAFAQLMRQHAPLVYGAAQRVLNNSALAEEATQETFFRLLREAQHIRTCLAGWLHRTATHVAVDLGRSAAARRRREQVAQELKPVEHWRELAPLLDEALTALPEEQQRLLIAHYLQGIPQRELAAQLRLSPATLHRRMRDALAQLRYELEERGSTLGLSALAGTLPLALVQEIPLKLSMTLGRLRLTAGLHAVTEPALGAGWWAKLVTERVVVTLAGTGLTVILALALIILLQTPPSPPRTSRALPEENLSAHAQQTHAQAVAALATSVQARAAEQRETALTTALGANWRQQWPDPARGRYLGVPGVSVPGPSDQLVSFEHPACMETDTLAGLYADGHVTQLTPAALRRQLEQQTGRPLRDLLPRLQPLAQ